MKAFILFLILLIAHLIFIACEEDDPFRRVGGCEYKGGIDNKFIIECHNLKSVDIEKSLNSALTAREHSDTNRKMSIRSQNQISINYYIRYAGIQFENNVLTPNSVFIERYTYSLILERSNIRDIESGAFASENNYHLKILELHDLNMDSIKKYAFSGLKSLSSLRITKSKLKMIDSYSLSVLTNLNYLTIFDCPNVAMRFERNDISKATFTFLHIFRASGNNFGTTINKFTFNGFYNIQAIHLPSNRIQTIATETFTSGNFMSLKQIDLSDNQLKTMPFSIDFLNYNNRIYNMIIINLNWNQWHCDCSMEPFRKYMQTLTDQEHFFEIICHSPPFLKGKRLIDCTDLCAETCDSSGVDIVRFANQFFERLSCNQYRLNVDNPSSNFVIIEIEDDSEPGENQRSINCYVGEESENRIILNVKSNRAHRLCKLSGQKIFSPFDCKSFSSCKIQNIWIDLEHQISTLVLSAFIAILSFLLGFAIIFLFNIKANPPKWQENVYSVIKNRKRCNSINLIGDRNIEAMRNFYQKRKVPIVTVDAITKSLDELQEVEKDPPQLPPRPSNWTEIVESYKRKTS